MFVSGAGFSTSSNSAASSANFWDDFRNTVNNNPAVQRSGLGGASPTSSADGAGVVNGINQLTTGTYQGSKSSEVSSGDPYDETGYSQAYWEFLKQIELLEMQRQFNSAEAQKNRDFQEYMSNTAVQRLVKDIESSGLNKWLALNGGGITGASTPSGSSATSSAGDVSQPNPTIYKEILQLFGSMFSSVLKAIASAI